MSPDAGPLLDLSFSQSSSSTSDPDTEIWSLIDEPEDEPGWVDYEIPAEPDAAATPQAWNLEAGTRRRIGVAAAVVPLLLSAGPVLAAPPADGNLAAPVQVQVQAEAPAQPSSASLFDGLVDRRVVVALQDGTIFRGTVLSVYEGKLVCAREGDGLMLRIDTGLIASVNVEGLKGSTPAQTGQGLITFGSIATAIGGALGIATLAVAGACAHDSYEPFCPYYSLPLGVASVVNLSVGIPLLAAGVSKRKKYRASQATPATPSLSAYVVPGRQGVMAGVGFRF